MEKAYNADNNSEIYAIFKWLLQITCWVEIRAWTVL